MKKSFLIGYLTIFMAWQGCLLALPQPARADNLQVGAINGVMPDFETDAKAPADVQMLGQMGMAFQQYASAFGCYKFAWGHLSPARTVITLEYLPDSGTDIDQWTRLMTITLNRLDGSEEQQRKTLDSMVAGYLEVFNGKGHVIRSTKYLDKATKEASLIIEYEIGDGAEKEHNIGILRRVSPTTSAFMQIQARGQTPAAATDADRIKSLLPPGSEPTP